MPLGRKHLRRSRDAPTGGIGLLKNYFHFTRLLDDWKGSAEPKVHGVGT